MDRIRKILIIAILLMFFVSPSYARPKHKMVGPVKGFVSSRYGMRSDPFSSHMRYHEGLDIAAKYGANVYAIQEGRVTFSGWKGGYGNLVMIDHYYPNIPRMPRIQTKYGHNSKLLVKTGDYVRRGDVIAYVGSTGRSTGPHLHFEVVYKGRTVDPIDYIRKLPSYLDYVSACREKEVHASRLTYTDAEKY